MKPIRNPTYYYSSVRTYVAIFLLSWAGAAHAYLDPATGSILLQGLLAGFAGAVVIGKLYWARVKNFFSRSDKNEEESLVESEKDTPSDNIDS